jgi:hypothetical protein
MIDPATIDTMVEEDVWAWLGDFVTVKNAFYHGKFAPCPYARKAVLAGQVDVRVFVKGDVRDFIRQQSTELRDDPQLSTRVIVFPPRVQFQWGISEYVETLNAELIAGGVFLNTGVTKTKSSRYPGSTRNDLYFIVVANRLQPVLDGAEALAKTGYYKDWPREQYELVVERRQRMAKRYGRN